MCRRGMFIILECTIYLFRYLFINASTRKKIIVSVEYIKVFITDKFILSLLILCTHPYMLYDLIVSKLKNCEIY